MAFLFYFYSIYLFLLSCLYETNCLTLTILIHFRVEIVFLIICSSDSAVHWKDSISTYVANGNILKCI